ncbi:MAG: ankyrin repeat domain-containing protein [Prolixibacteraceae bacterium]
MFTLFQKKTVKELIYDHDMERLQKRVDRSNVNLLDKEGHTPLYHALQANNMEVLEMLLHLGADINLPENSNEESVMVEGVKNFRLKQLELLVSYGEKLPNDIEDTPLLHYCLDKNCRNPSFLQFLITNGADIEVTNWSGESVMEHVLMMKKYDLRCVEVFLKAFISLGNVLDPKIFVSIVGTHIKSEKEKIQLLLLMLPSLKDLSKIHIERLFEKTVLRSHAELFLMLLENLPPYMMENKDRLHDFLSPVNFTPKNQKRLVAICQEKGVSLPIHEDILKRHPVASMAVPLTPYMIFQYAIDLSISISEKRVKLKDYYASKETIETQFDMDGKRVTALQALVLKHTSKPEVIEHVMLLLEMGAKIESYGECVLLFAARFHHIELIDLFLKHGADLSFISSNGNSFLSELCDVNTKKTSIGFIPSIIDILTLLKERCSAKNLNQLLYSDFTFRIEEQKVTRNFLAWTLSRDSLACHKLLQCLLDRSFVLDLTPEFEAEDNIKGCLLRHLIGAGDNRWIETFFANHPEYKVPKDHGLFHRALQMNIDLQNLKSLVDATEDLHHNDLISIDSESYSSFRFNYLLSLIYYIQQNTVQNKEKYMALAHYLIEKGVDINQKGTLTPRVNSSKVFMTETTFLIQCAEVDSMDLFEFGLQNGADPTIRVNANRDTFTINICDRYKKRDDRKLIPYFERLKQLGIVEVDTPNEIGETPVLSAAATCNNNVLQWLQKEGANFNVKGGVSNRSALISSIVSSSNIPIHRRMETVRLLLDYGMAVNQVDSEDKTPLMHAAYMGELSVVKLLLEREADIHALDSKGRNVVLHTVLGQYDYQYRQTEGLNEHIKSQILELLLAYGADLNQVPLDRFPAISEAVVQRRYILLTKLIALGADVNCKDTNYGYSPIAHALVMEDSTSLTTLLQCEDLNLNITNNEGDTLWHLLSFCHHTHIVGMIMDLLKERKVALLPNKHGQHPLHMAVLHGRMDIVEYLLHHFKSVDCLDNEHHTPLFYVALADSESVSMQIRLDMCQLLVENGAVLDVQNALGNTPLKVSQNSGLDPLSNLLIVLGANPEYGKRRIGFF